MRKGRAIITTIVICLILVLCACSNSGQQSGAATPPPESLTPSASQSQLNTPTSPTSSSPAVAPPATSPNNQPVQSNDPSDSTETGSPESTPGRVIISFEYVGQSGSASNQFAVWIEDMDGNYLQTVFATLWTANGGFGSRPDSIALWVEKSGIASMPSYYVDAVSGATPQTGEFSCVWNLADIDGKTVAPGEYRFFVEGTLRWKNYVLYSGVIEIGDDPATVQANAEYVYEGSSNQPALTNDSHENAMIGMVTASFIPGP